MLDANLPPQPKLELAPKLISGVETDDPRGLWSEERRFNFCKGTDVEAGEVDLQLAFRVTLDCVRR